MNFVGHVAVAAKLTGSRTDGAEVALGTALPDLAQMAGVRIDRSLLPAAVGEGVGLHYRTDAAFHSLAEFTSGARRLRGRLHQRGLASGPARAVGHAGFELLLDGCLLDRPGGDLALVEALQLAELAVAAVPASDRERWIALSADLRAGRWWLGYRDPSVVARRLERVLRGRRRLAFPLEELPLVADELASARPGISETAEAVVAEVAGALAQRPDRPVDRP